MRIAIVGAQNTGKSELIRALSAYSSNLKIPEKTYRDLIKEKNLSLNESGNMESQKIIREALVEMALENAGKEKILHDRCVLDNLVYTLWLYENDKFEETEEEIEEFITTSFHLTRESLKFYDVVFWTQLDESISITESENRSPDETYRMEINNIFDGVFEDYKKNTGLIFDKEDQPPMIPLNGDVNVKMETIKQYINDDGGLIETENSVLSNLDDVYDEMRLKEQISQ